MVTHQGHNRYSCSAVYWEHKREENDENMMEGEGRVYGYVVVLFEGGVLASYVVKSYANDFNMHGELFLNVVWDWLDYAEVFCSVFFFFFFSFLLCFAKGWVFSFLDSYFWFFGLFDVCLENEC